LPNDFRLWSETNSPRFINTPLSSGGACCLLLAIGNLPAKAFSWSFVFLLAFTLLVTPRMSLKLPRAKFILSFSDSMIFLSFVLFDGHAAIIIAALETLANCLHIKRSGVFFSPPDDFFQRQFGDARHDRHLPRLVRSF
jgi:hypothetical protein